MTPPLEQVPNGTRRDGDLLLVWLPLDVSLWHIEVFRESLEEEGRKERRNEGRKREEGQRSTVPTGRVACTQTGL